jgi:hypothetical protein
MQNLLIFFTDLCLWWGIKKSKMFNFALGGSGYDLVFFPERTGEEYQYGDNLQTTN